MRNSTINNGYTIRERGEMKLTKNQKRNQRSEELFIDEKGIATVKNQLNESYQSGVIEQLHNNKGIYTFNNRKN